jgi:hypothetical protein
MGKLVSGFSVGTLVWIVSLEYLFTRDRDELLSVLEQVSPRAVKFLLVPVRRGEVVGKVRALFWRRTRAMEK